MKTNRILEGVHKQLRKNDLLFLMAELGIVTLAVTLPHIAAAAFLIKVLQEKNSRLPAKKIKNSFYYLKRRGLLSVESRHGQTVISITPEATRLMRYQELESAFKEKQKKRWDGRWFVVMFDIPNQKTTARNALRTMLHKLGFFYLQKSSWVYPFDCRSELNFLKDFFLLSESEFRVLVCTTIGDDKKIRKHFGI